MRTPQVKIAKLSLSETDKSHVLNISYELLFSDLWFTQTVVFERKESEEKETLKLEI